MPLTPKGLVEVEQSVRQALSRIDSRIDKLQLDLETIQWELTDLRSIRATVLALIELVQKETSK